MSVVTTESRPSPFTTTRESKIVKFAAMADKGAHAALHLLTDTASEVVSALRDPYSNEFIFTEQGNPIQISGTPGSRPLFTETDAETILKSRRVFRK